MFTLDFYDKPNYDSIKKYFRLKIQNIKMKSKMKEIIRAPNLPNEDTKTQSSNDCNNSDELTGFLVQTDDNDNEMNVSSS